MDVSVDGELTNTRDDDFFRIDFNQLTKPTNLQNSAVLRMLEEEEARQRSGQPSKYYLDKDSSGSFGEVVSRCEHAVPLVSA